MHRHRQPCRNRRLQDATRLSLLLKGGLAKVLPGARERSLSPFRRRVFRLHPDVFPRSKTYRRVRYLLYQCTMCWLFSIVFVSGIGSHAYGSWTSKSDPWRMWPRHFLPNNFPNARVMTYGHKAKLRGTGFGQLLDYGRSFGDALNQARKNVGCLCFSSYSPHLPRLIGIGPKPTHSVCRSLLWRQHIEKCRFQSIYGISSTDKLVFSQGSTDWRSNNESHLWNLVLCGSTSWDGCRRHDCCDRV